MKKQRLQLKIVLDDLGISQKALGKAIKLDPRALCDLINHRHWRPSLNQAAIKKAITEFVRKHGGDTRRLFEVAAPRVNAALPSPPSSPSESDEENHMLLRKQSLTPEARRHFQLPRDPFADPQTHEDVYLNAEIRYVRESMYQVARHGGFMAVVGESGSGKTTLREELISRLQREEQAVIVIEPYVLAMEAQDKVGKTLRSTHIVEAIMSSVAPLAKTRTSPEARFRAVHHALRDSARAGHSHVLVIEEAHSLPLPTLKHLKRFRELKDGLRPLLSIVLMGQPELAVKLSEHNPEVREVVQRIEVLTLPALGTDLDAYLKHRFSRIGVPLDKVMTQGAIDALRTKLTPPRGSGSLLYPLVIANALTAAMNMAAQVKLAQLTADVVQGL